MFETELVGSGGGAAALQGLRLAVARGAAIAGGLRGLERLAEGEPGAVADGADVIR